MRLSFLGAAEEVTGSCYLVETGTARFIIDCGLFQGGREASDRNYGPFAFDPRALDFVLLSHAHIDHSGLLPRLVAAGFRGRVFTTPATADLLRVMLLDAAHIQEKEAAWRARATRHARREERTHLEPLYTVAEAETCCRQLEAVDYGVISASGMCDAGRIKHHLEHNLGRRECTVIFTGFQAQGTLGRRIVDGAASVRIFGEEIAVRAAIYTIGGLSAHADQAGLLAWLRHFRRAPRQAFVVHGEAATARVFCDTVRAELGWNATVPAARSVAVL